VETEGAKRKGPRFYGLKQNYQRKTPSRRRFWKARRKREQALWPSAASAAALEKMCWLRRHAERARAHEEWLRMHPLVLELRLLQHHQKMHLVPLRQCQLEQTPAYT
jgi:hypothetical protein